MKRANHHLRRIDQAVMQSGNLTRPEATCPMRFFQLPAQTLLAGPDASEGEEALLELTGQQGSVLQVCDRLSLSVQHFLNALDDFIAMGQEDPEKFDVCLKRHLAGARSGRLILRGRQRLRGLGSQEARLYRLSSP